MADSNITNLAAVTSVDLDADELAIYQGSSTKKLTPSQLAMPRVLYQGTQTHTGDINVTTLKLVTVPGGLMGANGAIEIKTLFHIDIVPSVTWMNRITAAAGTADDLDTNMWNKNTADKWWHVAAMIYATGSTSAQMTSGRNYNFNLGATSAGTDPAAYTIDTTADWSIWFGCQIADAADNDHVITASMNVLFHPGTDD